MEQVLFYFSFELYNDKYSGKAVIIEDYGGKEFQFFDKKNKKCSVSVVSNCNRLNGIYINDKEYANGFLLEVTCFHPVQYKYLVNKTDIEKLLAKDIASRINLSGFSPKEIKFMYGDFYHADNKFEEIIL